VPGTPKHIDLPTFQQQKGLLLVQLREQAKGCPDIRVDFDRVPEGRAERLSDGMLVKDTGTVIPRHAALSLIRAILANLLAVLREE